MPLMWFTWMDQLEAARARHAFEDRWYRDRGEEGWRAERLGHLAYAELNAGNWEEAERMIEESCATLEQMGLRVGPWGMVWRIRANVDLHRGRIERARETLLTLAEDSERTGHSFFAAVALNTLGSVELAAGDAEAADRAFVAFRRHLDTIGTVAAPGPRARRRTTSRRSSSSVELERATVCPGAPRMARPHDPTSVDHARAPPRAGARAGGEGRPRRGAPGARRARRRCGRPRPL